MKNNIWIFCGLVFLGLSMMISAYMMSNNDSDVQQVNGSLTLYEAYNESDDTDYLAIGEIAGLLGYDDIDTFKNDVLADNIPRLPYIKLNDHLIFSRTAFNEWLISEARGY